MMWVSACQGPETSAADAAPPGSVSLSLSLSGSFGQQLPATQEFKAIHVLHGTLTATRTTDSQVFTFDWSLSLDDASWDIQSNKTIVIEPGPYQFTLVFSDSSYQYFAHGAAVIGDGENTVNLTITPVLGDIEIDPTLSEVAALRFHYPANQLASLTNPRIGVTIDGGAEQIIDFNPATGITDVYVLIADGPHTIQLSLYDGAVQRGRSVPEQEAVTVVLGQDIHMDLIPLHGETVFEISNAGGDLDVEIEIPGEVVQEAGGVANVEALLSLVGPNNPFVEVPLTLVPDGSDYEANVTLTGINYDTVTYSLTFNDISTTPKDPIASCTGTVELDQTARSVTCDLQLRRRAVAGGNILAVVGVNVFDPGWTPVAGAVVANGTQPVGISGSGSFGTDGYLRLYLLPGTHLLTAIDVTSQRFGQATITVDSLDVTNVDIILDQTMFICAGTAVCPGDEFTPTGPCGNPPHVCSDQGTQPGIWTSFLCVAGGCIPSETPGTNPCPLNPEGRECAPAQTTSTQCSYTNYCDESATRTVTTTTHTCQSGGCGSNSSTQTVNCSRTRDGRSCNGGAGTCANDICVVITPCSCPPFHKCCEPGVCKPFGTQCR